MRSLIAAFLVSTLLTGPALSQQKADDHAAHGSASPAAAASGADMAEGEVRRINRDSGKLTLRHGEIRHLDMPAMTMVFQVSEPALLDKVKVGDKVKFLVQKATAGYIVTAIEPVK